MWGKGEGKDISIKTGLTESIFVPSDTFSFRTLDIFKTVDINIRRRLYDIYKYDFELFGYDWSKYFKS